MIKKKNFIILGSTSFIGKNFHRFLLKKNIKVKGFGSKQINFLKAKESSKIQNYINKNSIIFFLSFNKIQKNASFDDFLNNILLIKNFIQSLKKQKPKKIFFFSSQVVYGEDTNNNNTREITIPDPTSFYGIAKYTSERLLMNFCNKEKISLIILRIPRVYGIGDNQNNYGPTMFTALAKKNKPIEIWGDGKEKRDYVFINDLNKILFKLSKKNFSGIINLCSGNSVSFIKIINLIKKILKRDIIILKKKRSRKKVNHIMQNKLLKDKIGKFKFTSMEQGLQIMLSNQ